MIGRILRRLRLPALEWDQGLVQAAAMMTIRAIEQVERLLHGVGSEDWRSVSGLLKRWAIDPAFRTSRRIEV
jgi:hypothetical protein